MTNLEAKRSKIKTKIRLVIHLVKKELKVLGQAQQLVKEQMERLGIPYPLLKEINLGDTTLEKVEVFKAELQEIEKEIREYSLVDPRYIWYNELLELREFLLKHMEKIDKKSKKA